MTRNRLEIFFDVHNKPRLRSRFNEEKDANSTLGDSKINSVVTLKQLAESSIR